jgi:hypothetical protein
MRRIGAREHRYKVKLWRLIIIKSGKKKKVMCVCVCVCVCVCMCVCWIYILPSMDFLFLLL